MLTCPWCSNSGVHQAARAGRARAGPAKTSPSWTTATGGRVARRTQAQAPAKVRQRCLQCCKRSRPERAK
eukprot:61961-Alexandrium_andersonii.AAC.1